MTQILRKSVIISNPGFWLLTNIYHGKNISQSYNESHRRLSVPPRETNPASTAKSCSLFTTLCLSHIQYCTGLWCFGSETIINAFQRICKKFMRSIFNLPKKAQISHYRNNLLTIWNLCELKIAIFVNKFHKSVQQPTIDQIYWSENLEWNPFVIAKNVCFRKFKKNLTEYLLAIQ